MASGEASPRRFAVAGATLFAGVLLGMVLSATFRWSPYYWQWLAYHNALVVGVLIYLFLSDSDDAAPVVVKMSATHPRDASARRNDPERTLSTVGE